MYKLIDYSHWNLNGKGNNILTQLTPHEIQVWQKALPFQDKRNDKGHAEFVTYFAVNLLKYVKAERGIVVPAAILHDIGWSQMSKEEIAQFYLPNWRDFEPQLRKRHQEEGVNLAGKILDGVNYPQEFIPKILEIISQHDTRQGFLNSEDGIARDADKIWVFSLPCCRLAIRKKRNFNKSIYDQLSEWLSQKGFFYLDISRETAKIEFQNTLNNLDEAQRDYLKNR